LGIRATGQVGTANAALEKGVARKQQALLPPGSALAIVAAFNDEADAALCVPGGAQYAGQKAAPAQSVTFFHEVSDLDRFGGRNAEPLRLHVERVVEPQIGVVNQNGRPGRPMQRGKAANMVDVSVRANYRANPQLVAREYFQNAIDFVTGIDDDGVTCRPIAEYRAVAL